MKKWICLLLLAVLCFSLVACRGNGDDSSVPAPPVSNTPSESEPEEDLPRLEAAYLTGMEKTADYPEGQRIAAVMVNNVPSTRPAYGLSDAKILIEIDGNASITRFMALYEDYKTMPRVGGVRSARDPFVQLLIPTYGFYVHEGPSENQPARLMLQQYDYYGNYDLDSVVWKQSDRNAKTYSWFNTDAETITKAVESRGYDDKRTYNSPFFYFARYDQPARLPEEGDATEFTIVLTPSYRTYFDYDDASKKYMMSMYNSSTNMVEPTLDGNNDVQLSFENVLVMFAPMSIYPNTGGEQLTNVDFSQGGPAFYFSQGRFAGVLWRKGAPDSPLRLEKTDGSGDPVEVNVGKTYIAVVDDTRSEDFYNSLVAGPAGETAMGGQQTGGEVDSAD